MQSVGKFVVLMGISLAIVGGMLWLGGRLGMGSLPGDLKLTGEGWSCFVPIATSLVLSILLTIVLNVLLRFLNR